MSPNDLGCCAADSSLLALLTGDPQLLGPDLRFLERRVAASELIYDRLAAWTAKYDKHQLAHSLQAAGILAAPVNNGRDVHDSSALRSRGRIVTLTHPEAGTHDYPTVAFHFERTPGSIRQPSPLFGQHNDLVLTELANFTGAEVDGLRRTAVVHDAPMPGELS